MFYSENYLERSKKLDANIDEYLKEFCNYECRYFLINMY